MEFFLSLPQLLGQDEKLVKYWKNMNIVPYHPFDIFLQNGQKFILSGWILEKL
jgi:hypothetical protein